MTRINFNHYLFFIVAAHRDGYLVDKFGLDDDIEFTFSEYVKSQVSLFIPLDKDRNRTLDKYAKVYRHLVHYEKVDNMILHNVVGWFYSDMGNMFLNSTFCRFMPEKKFTIYFEDDLNDFVPCVFSIKEERSQLEAILLGSADAGDGSDVENKYASVMNRSVSDLVALRDIGLTDRIIQAFVLLYMSENHGLRKVSFKE
jgi:hypothetical protein